VCVKLYIEGSRVAGAEIGCNKVGAEWEPSGSRLKTGAEVGAGLAHQFSDIKPPLLNQQPPDIRYLHSLISVLLYNKRNLLMFLHCTQDIPACHPRSSIINVRDASKWCCELLGHRVSQHEGSSQVGGI
jgi:hypothetical protein